MRRRVITKKKKSQFRKRVARIAKTVALRNEETKYLNQNSLDGAGTGFGLYHNSGNSSASPAPMYWQVFQNCIAGTGQNQRIGRAITLRSMDLRIYVEQASTLAPYVRYALIEVEPDLASPPTLTSLFDAASGFPNYVYAPFRMPWGLAGYVKKVWWDKTIKLTPSDSLGTAGGAAHQVVKAKIKFHNKKFEFQSDTTTPGAAFGSMSDFYLIATSYGRYASATTAIMAFSQFSYRLYYKDA